MKREFSHIVILNDKDSGVWSEAMNVYGPFKTNRKQEFLDELQKTVEEGMEAVIMGGDFNLILYVEEKSTHQKEVDGCFQQPHL